MYLKRSATYYRGTSQVALRAPFLLLIQPDKQSIAETCAPSNTFALVRNVALQQCGQFMMGRANIGGKWRTVSGAYGNDGLPMNFEGKLPADAVVLPAKLYEQWKNGGGHNSAGAEASALRAWAIQQWSVK